MGKTSWAEENGLFKWGAAVYLRPGETQEHLLKRFSKKVWKLGILKAVHAKEYYQKPSEKRKQKQFRARKRAEALLNG